MYQVRDSMPCLLYWLASVLAGFVLASTRPTHASHTPFFLPTRQIDYLVRFGDVTTATSIVPTIDDVKYMGDLNIPPWSTGSNQRYVYYGAALWLDQGAMLRFYLNTTIQVQQQELSMHMAQYLGGTPYGFSVRSLPASPYACTANANMFENAAASTTTLLNSGGFASGIYTVEYTGAYQFNYCESLYPVATD